MILYNYASFEVFMLMSEIKPQNNKKKMPKTHKKVYNYTHVWYP